MKLLAALIASTGIAAWISWGTAQDRDDDGVEVQTRGPVHEAFADPALARPEAPPAVTKKPPEPIPELPAEMKPDDESAVWIPGYWGWDDERENFLWVSGIWRLPPPQKNWTPGYWHEVQGGWQWVSGYWADDAPVELLPPPPEPVAEAIPPPPDQASVYVPGCWVYRDTRYWWRPGYWIAYRIGWVWVPPCYLWTPGGHIFCEGRWDRDLRRRGILCAPVVIDLRVVVRAGWVYRPRHVVRDDFLIQAMFLNVQRNHYYFGDFYDARYAKRGYQPWVDVRFRGRFSDPLFTYYRWAHRDQADWGDRLKETYVAREQGKLARPPRTFAAQQKLAPGNKDLRVTVSVKEVQTIALKPVAQAEVQQVQKEVQEARTVAQTRRQLEAKVAAKGKIERPVKIDLPRAKGQVGKPQTGEKPPPPPKFKEVDKLPKDKELDPKDKDKPPVKDKITPPDKDKLPPPDKDKPPLKEKPPIKEKVKPPDKDKPPRPDRDRRPGKEKEKPPPKEKPMPDKDKTPVKDKDKPPLAERTNRLSHGSLICPQDDRRDVVSLSCLRFCDRDGPRCARICASHPQASLTLDRYSLIPAGVKARAATGRSPLRLRDQFFAAPWRAGSAESLCDVGVEGNRALREVACCETNGHE